MSTNGTSPDGSGMVGWVSPDARRNTWDIILSCLSIFFVCSWKCVHLNPPTAREARGGWHEVWKIPIFPKWSLLRKWGRRSMWMGIISVAPEMGVALSVEQWLEARKASKHFGGACTMSHAFFFNMGGVVLREVTHIEPKPPAVEGGDAIEKTASATVTSADDQVDEEATDPAGKKTVDHTSVDYLASVGDLDLAGIAAIPTEDEIADRSKSDAFTKLFALVQSSWLIVSSIARVHNGYAITELELATMAFIVCALVMYFFWWNKPFGIEHRWVMVRTLKLGDRPREIEIRNRLIGGDYMETRDPTAVYYEDQRVSDLSWNAFTELVLRNELMAEGNVGDHIPTLALYLSGMAFSAVHVAAWNWEFPSHLIKILWRTSTVAAFGASFLPIISMFLGLLFNLTKSIDWIGDVLRFIFFGLGYGGLAVYVVSRLVILFLSFYCFVAMPSSAYEKVEWTGYIPHFS
ncbi:hypothetical protein B0T14DRAFT_275320 [Immersiella caudata]|uniref:Uncharacterized protein n=1 Tax=Immersiella caudata TaxID=314043 RepID=A0AA39TN04_9PEZI|nr:hypothetical protein B0T14DRAFT_275320 [Immersiella caudata]